MAKETVEMVVMNENVSYHLIFLNNPLFAHNNVSRTSEFNGIYCAHQNSKIPCRIRGSNLTAI